MQSDQLCSIGADMKSATAQSLSIYNLLLYEEHIYTSVCTVIEVKLNKYSYIYSIGMSYMFVCLLRISEVEPRDAGKYICTLQTFPKQTLIKFLQVDGESAALMVFTISHGAFGEGIFPI